jgi:hypothetical protein|uniref:Uncharacterized protein n=1 Tax=Desulfobacca acetoxidans TaxID=60893 RepID=A0A7V6A2N7_9BACT
MITLGVLMMLLVLRLGVSHALGTPAWPKFRSAAGVAGYSAAPSAQWDKSLRTLNSDNDDDDDDDNGDDGPTISA